MKTTYFWKASHEPVPNTRYVCISRSRPDWANEMEAYEPLMPSWDIIRLVHEQGNDGNNNAYKGWACLNEYKQVYFAQLKQLDAKQVAADLQDATLVCFESAKDIISGKKFCHRRMVAGWIETETGIVVPEEMREKEKDLIVPAIFESR